MLETLDAFESARDLGRQRLWLDLKDPDNCFTFVLLRRALRLVGLNYKLRELQDKLRLHARLWKRFQMFRRNLFREVRRRFWHDVPARALAIKL